MEVGKTYHIYTHANGFENLFRSEENYHYFLLRYQHFIEPVADTLAYCLMPNHVHFLVRIKSQKEIESIFKETETLEVFKNLQGLNPIEKRISKQFSNLSNSYTKAFNKMYNRKGSLFIPNFKRKEIESDRYLTNIIRYIHANPVHHGFVETIHDWTWSSYHEILSDDTSTWIKREETVNWFGNKHEFVEFHRQSVSLEKEMEVD